LAQVLGRAASDQRSNRLLLRDAVDPATAAGQLGDVDLDEFPVGKGRLYHRPGSRKFPMHAMRISGS